MQLPKESEDHVMEETKERKLLFSRKIVGELTVPERPDLTFIRVEPELELSKMSRHLRRGGSSKKEHHSLPNFFHASCSLRMISALISSGVWRTAAGPRERMRRMTSSRSKR